MDWFDVEPLMRGPMPSALPRNAPATAPPPRVAPVPAASSEEIGIVAKTLWGEARGEPETGMRAVACVIGNRKARHWRGKLGFADVCLDRWQFSCWNEKDPNRLRMDAIERNPDAVYIRALTIARELISGQLADFTFGATHYFATSLRRRPDWALGKNPCYQIGRHIFFNNVK
ncbi:cell wall hydrolase [Solimonas sp. K1W22B-7]|nr:cell wall hydrolase [Solimonas sp. K1W22B-7]